MLLPRLSRAGLDYTATQKTKISIFAVFSALSKQPELVLLNFAEVMDSVTATSYARFRHHSLSVCAVGQDAENWRMRVTFPA
jgi:hypothetical protein